MTGPAVQLASQTEILEAVPFAMIQPGARSEDRGVRLGGPVVEGFIFGIYIKLERMDGWMEGGRRHLEHLQQI